MGSRLLPCPSCARHVRAFEAACPFCAAALPAVAPAAPVARTAGKRLSRAALFALGASAAAVAACSGSIAPGPAAGDSGALDGTPDGDQQIAPPYGIPPMDAGNDVESTLPLYGAPPMDGG